MRSFNTSGPNIPSQHYTIQRHDLIKKGMDLVRHERYFTIWAPRQTGKSTYFLQLGEALKQIGYQVAYMNFESYKNSSLESFLEVFTARIYQFWNLQLVPQEITKLFFDISKVKNQKLVLIIDEVEGINAEYLGDFLHAVREAYHTRSEHSLKSVILVGVTNILGVISDNASPFNITDNLEVQYFTNDEVNELLSQHEKETGQQFSEAVKNKISQITANQPGLVNGFAKKLVEDHPQKLEITYEDYLKVEDWYLTEAIDKNFANILNKAQEDRAFVERLLFTEDKIPFRIDRPSIKRLHTNGLIRKGEDGNVEFWVPFYKKRLYDAFYPYTNGEQKYIRRTLLVEDFYDTDGRLKLDKLIGSYQDYVKRRGFYPHRVQDSQGNYPSIREAALIYSFETYIHAAITELGGKIYREAHTGLGRSDMIIYVNEEELVIETKIYISPKRFEEGKRQLAYYCRSLGQQRGIYLVYCPNDIRYPERVKENDELIEGVRILTHLVSYDETSW